ncbi:MAG: DUF4418 family protein [Ruminococcus sp.]|nr:DUF4418 family protein [Ruminococcus sp.]
MKNSRSTNAAGIAMIIVGAILCIGVKAVFHACGAKDDGTFMNCHNAENAAAVLGAAMMILSAFSLFIRKKGVRICTAALTAAAGIFAAVIPNNVIHLCMMESMRCHAVMRPAVIICGIIGAAVSVLFIISVLLSRSAEGEK